eukprot:TRINITY_DN1433_c0_g1_i12.p1 TRINITY_DN1433_c0_g1~~TRINITY_DN1433_c0_g1_i12.p1  ORF type:complete len:134 (-),score=13.23 TRINITY_DN1433_c0_g1_i12:659-1060(-)
MEVERYDEENKNEIHRPNRNNDERIPLRRRAKKVKPWFPSTLPTNYQGVYLPNEICKQRNYSIVALFFQTLSTIAGYTFFFLRRVNHFFSFLLTIKEQILPLCEYYLAGDYSGWLLRCPGTEKVADCDPWPGI